MAMPTWMKTEVQQMDMHHKIKAIHGSSNAANVVNDSVATAAPVEAAKPKVEPTPEEQKQEKLRVRRFNRAVKDADALLDKLGMGINKGENKGRER